MLSADAVSLGLIVTELVINALKYAFPDQSKTAAVTVRYEINGADWKLSVSDNGIGKTEKRWRARQGAGWAPVWCGRWPSNWRPRWPPSAAQPA